MMHQKSQEISHESSLPGARQGLWNHFIIMGQSVWNTSSIKSGKENVDNLIGSLAAVNLARVRVEEGFYN
ncbi:hypothetical protein OIU78_025438 [Salix suchowensis]|nr:hypothetical protein OIU78_025438 [Salix suchowensis]